MALAIAPPGHRLAAPLGHRLHRIRSTLAAARRPVIRRVTELAAGYLAHTTPTTPATEQAPTSAHPTNHARHAPSSRRAWFLEQISGVLDPLAQHCEGQPAATIRPILARTWRQEFGRRLNEPTLSDLAAALAQGRPWTQTLWTDGW
jgi:hypothetical protein